MADQTAKPDEPAKAEQKPADTPDKAMEKAQKDAAKEREAEGGYQ
jgi:hypothetical protein